MTLARREELVWKANRFYLRYGSEVDNLRKLVEVNLKQLCLAYTLDNRLPRDSVEVVTRLKSLTSFLDKLDRQGWPDFYYPTEVAKDLIGARVICWFVEDCYGILELLQQSSQFKLEPGSIEDYIENPKPSGYRSVHALADFAYDSVARTNGHRELVPRTMVCEIQIRTRLQDAFGQLTHDFPYKFPDPDVAMACQARVAAMATALAEQDRVAVSIRQMVQQAQAPEKRVGFSSDLPPEPTSARSDGPQPAAKRP